MDWTFWSFVVAGVAVVLSQLPPLRDLLGPGRATLEVHGRIQLQHMIGYPNSAVYLSVSNVGRRSVRITAIDLLFSRGGQEICRLDGVQYYVDPKDVKPILLVPFTLPGGGEWGHTVTFNQSLDPQEEKKLGGLRSALRMNIVRKVEERNRNDPEDKALVVADEAVLRPLLDVFEEQFTWNVGEYQVEIRVHSSNAKGATASRFRFTVYESDAAELRGYASEYKFGYGPAIDVEHHRGVWLKLTPA